MLTLQQMKNRESPILLGLQGGVDSKKCQHLHF